MNLTINSDTSLQTAIGELRDLYREHRFLRVAVKTGKDRSLDQNSISHIWYDQISRELREDTALEVKCFCKLHFGVPILRAEDTEFREFYDSAMKSKFSYEQKLAAMRYMPITSIMTKPQLSQYLVAMQAAYADRITLEFPPEHP